MVRQCVFIVTSLLLGCGGGGGSDSAAVVETTSGSGAMVPMSAAVHGATPTTVQLEGCVVNTRWTGSVGATVHARTEQGRLVGTAVTDGRGVYVLTVPARSTVVVDTAIAGLGGLTLMTGSAAISAGGCLLVEI